MMVFVIVFFTHWITREIFIAPNFFLKIIWDGLVPLSMCSQYVMQILHTLDVITYVFRICIFPPFGQVLHKMYAGFI